MAHPDPTELTHARVGKPMERCCKSHADWPTLTQHLIDAYPAITLEEIVRAVAEAKTATDTMDFGGAEALVTGEVLARRQLLERTAGGSPDGGQPAVGTLQASGSAPTP